MEFDEISAIAQAMRTSKRPNTLRVYGLAWGQWRRWCEETSRRSCPAEPFEVALYLTERAKDPGHGPDGRLSIGSLSVALRAIKHYHGLFNQPTPTDHPVVRRTLAGLREQLRRPVKQAPGLTAEKFKRVIATACEPRQHTTRMEAVHVAKRRGIRDVALLGTMRDAMLRRQEAADLTWADVEFLPDGSGRVTVQRSKTNPEPAVLPLRAGTVDWLKRHRPDDVKSTDRVFGVTTGHGLHLIIRNACKHAGLGDDYGGHSPRVGMAQDLSVAGASVAQIMQAGRWRSAEMVSQYTKGLEADRSAVATFSLPDYED